MDILEIFAVKEDQEKGAWLELRHPVTGEPTGLKLRIAGPDSEVQRRARHRMEDSLRKQASARNGIAAAEKRDHLMTAFLAGIIVDWEVKQDGKPLPLRHEHVARLIDAGTWVREQIDTFAALRSQYYADPVGTPESDIDPETDATAEG